MEISEREFPPLLASELFELESPWFLEVVLKMLTSCSYRGTPNSLWTTVQEVDFRGFEMAFNSIQGRQMFCGHSIALRV